MIKGYDDLLRSHGVYFLPWIGDKYERGFCGRKFLLLGESHYSQWDGVDHVLKPTFTRECVGEVRGREPGARFWRNIEQALLNEHREDGWCPGGGPRLWDRFAFYNYVQTSVAGGPRVSPSQQQFIESLSPFLGLIEILQPQRVLVCGKRLWRDMGPTKLQPHKDVQAYELSDGAFVWCLAINHPSCGGFSWSQTHQVIKAFLRDPSEAASVLKFKKPTLH